jgi:hypothetical protein
MRGKQVIRAALSQTNDKKPPQHISLWWLHRHGEHITVSLVSDFSIYNTHKEVAMIAKVTSRLKLIKILISITFCAVPNTCSVEIATSKSATIAQLMKDGLISIQDLNLILSFENFS